MKAWQAEGRAVFGAALAWRQTDDLAAAGIPEARRAALSVFLDRARAGRFALDRNSVVVVDELGLLGTRQLLELLRLRERHGFRLVAVGDPKQCRSIEAGPVVELLRRALGPDALPEILSTVRQRSEEERARSLLFREGRAAEALEGKREDGTARLIAGDYAQAVAGIAALWQERRAANAGEAGYALSVSAPTNRDARAIGAAIRAHRRAAGELGPDRVVLEACDQGGERYELPLAVGDRVRLFARTNAAGAGRGVLGNNGSVLEVRAISGEGVRLRNSAGREGLVAWNTLRDRNSGRIRLSYGDVLTIDATQGLTSTEHIEAMPAGTAGVDAHKAYTAASRHRRATFLVVAEGAERREIAGRRPLGDPRPIREADVWANVARNLSRRPEAEGALAFLERAHGLRREAAVAMGAGLRAIERREADGLAATTLRPRLQRQRVVAPAGRAAARLDEGVRRQGALLDGMDRLLPAVREAVTGVLTELRPAVAAALARLRERPERVAARRREAELAALREQLVGMRMAAFRGEQRWGFVSVTEGMRQQWAEQATVEEARQRQAVGAMGAAELRGTVRHEDTMRRWDERRQRRAAARYRGPGPGW
ncbi:Conjugal transfer protein traA (plasmid) [Roseomonas mucosa]|nr:Conjugal transfer protein traA [Roseomonas mucosa]